MGGLAGALSRAEENAELARRKYSSMTISEILSRIIIRLLISWFFIVFVCILMYLYPEVVSDRLLATILLIFVLTEMSTELALWAFTYQGMRKTEGPLIDLQRFSTITKEGWSRAEIVLDLTAPIFKWLDELRERMGLDWRKKGSAPPQATPNTPVTVGDLVDGLKALATAIEGQNARLERLERTGQVSHMRENREGVRVVRKEDGKVVWGTEGLK